jgi:PAS domain S-box-containing protein
MIANNPQAVGLSFASTTNAEPLSPAKSKGDSLVRDRFLDCPTLQPGFMRTKGLCNGVARHASWDSFYNIQSRRKAMKKFLPYPLRVALIFLAFGVLWIVGTDWLVFVQAEAPARIATQSTYKGLFFILASAILIYFVLHQEYRARSRAESTRGESEARYLSLFENMLNGLAYCRMIYKGGKPVDFVFLEVNRAFERLTGLKDAVGKKVTEIIPGIRESNPELFKIYGRVAAAGRPETFETYVKGLDSWFEVSVYSPEKDRFVAIFDVITERKWAEENARQLNERLTLATKAAGMGVWDWDVQRDQLVWDDQMYELYGVRKQDFSGAYEAWLNGLHPDDRLECDRISKQALSGENEYDTEFRVVWPDGTIRHLKARAQVIRDAQGTPLRMIGVNYDITERKQAEREIDLLARFPAENPSPVLRLLRDGTILYANAGSGEVLAAWDRRQGEVVAEDLRGIVSDVLANRTGRLTELRCGDKIYSFYVMPVLGTDYVNLYGRDITAGIQAEEALRASEERFRRIFEEGQFGITIAGPDYRFLDANPAFCKMIGYSIEELRQLTFAEITAPERVEQDAEGVRAMTRGEKPDYRTEKKYKKKDGSTLWGSLVVSPVRDARGRILYYLAMVEDVSERKRAEESLRETQQLYENVFRLSPEVIVVTTEDEGRYLAVNDAHERVTGYSGEEVIGRRVEEFEVWETPEHRKKMIALLDEQGMVSNEEVRFIRRSGEPYTALLSMVRLELGGQKCLISMVSDISDRKKAEEALRASEQRFRSLADQAPLMIGMTDECGKITFLNKTWLEFRGKTLEEEAGWAWVAGLHPADRDRVVAEIESAVGQRLPYSIEYRIQDRLGSYHWLLDTAAPFQGPDGRPQGYIGTAVDITGRKAAEEALKGSEQRYRSLAEAAHDMIYILDEAGRVKYVNSFGASQFHRQPEDLVGALQKDLFPPEISQRQNENVRKVFVSSEPLYVEAPSVLSGRPLWLGTWLVPLRDQDGQVDSVMGLSRDITERKEAEAALRQKEEDYRQLFEAESDAIFLIDNTTGRILEANEAACKLYGYSRKELLARRDADLSAEPVRTEQVTRETAPLAEQVIHIPLRYHRSKAGIVFPVEITGRFFMHQGKTVHIAAIRDITERRKAEEKIKAALEEKDALLREVHHRVKNNLQAMIYLVEMQLTQIRSESTRQFLRELQEQARAMSLVYEQLYQSENLAQVAMQPYLEQLTVGVVQAIAPALEIDLDLKLSAVSLDVSQAMPCGLIVNELITNTIKYAFPSSFTRRPKLSISLKAQRDKYTLIVKDNGVGLPAGTDWRKTKSLGLRLVNMWATHQLGGTLDVCSEAGACYTITFRTREGADDADR